MYINAWHQFHRNGAVTIRQYCDRSNSGWQPIL